MIFFSWGEKVETVIETNAGFAEIFFTKLLKTNDTADYFL